VVNENVNVTGDLTVVGTTSLQNNVGIANTAPIHDLDVGSNLYVDDQGSNVLHVTGNVYATRFVGDGAFLENIASNLHEITTNGNVTTNTLQFDGSTSLVTTGSVGVANTAPIHDLDVGSNLYVDDQGSNVLHVTGNVYATRFVGDGAFLENIASNLHEITTNGNVTINTVQFDGATALVTTGKVGIANTAPIHDLDVGSNLYVDDQGSNVLHVTGNVYATRFVGDGAFLENIASNLHEITTNGNVTTNTVQFDGSTALVTTGNVGIANAAPEHELSVTGNVYISSEVNVTGGLITNLGGLTKKTYGYSGGTITASTTPEINVVFDSQLFSAKITAHLVEPTSNISVLNLDVTGGTGRNIGKGFLSIVGDQNSKHWDSTINTTDTTVTLTPSVGLLSDGTYGVHVEYTSPLGTGGVVSIDKNNTNEITFDY
jgi:sorbitol-specific phosphotransferase system component IIA